VKTVLVVDDDQMALTLSKDVLSAAGYNVLTAEEGPSCLEIAANQKPDLILLDLMMPKMDGYSTLTQLKNNSATTPIPVIMVTAVGYELNRTLALKMGALDYLTKPVDITHLNLRLPGI